MDASRSQHTLKIATVEDSSIVAERLQAVLRDLGYVHYAGNATNIEDALYLILQQKPDVVILDIHLSEAKSRGTGMDLIPVLRNTYPDMVIIMLTNFSDEQYRAKCMLLGADHFYDKTNELDKVLDTVQQIHGLRMKTVTTHDQPGIQAPSIPSLRGLDTSAASIDSSALTAIEAKYEAALETIRRSESNLAAIVENTEDIIYSIDREMKFITFNTSFKNIVHRVYGVHLEPGESAFAFLQSIDAAEARDWERIYTLALTGEVQKFAKQYEYKDEPYFYRFSINPIWENDAVIGLSCFGRDVTAKKLAEDKIIELNGSLELRVTERTLELEEAYKDLEAFSYTVSHDLKSPLRLLTGYCRILLKDHKDNLNEEGKEYLEIIAERARKMSQLIDDLMRFSRLGRTAREMEETDMAALVAGVIDEVNAHSGYKVEIKAGPMKHAACDPRLMKQVWENLIYNAVKYSSKRNDPSIQIGEQEVDGERIYYIEDNGVGFDMKHAHKLFGVFQRLHTQEEFEGTGIGLATVQRIIHKHEGRIWAEAEVNEGATFFFTISPRQTPQV